MQKQRFLLLGVLLTSLVTLALEIVLTRIFSVTMWYHFAFLTISIALMGSALAIHVGFQETLVAATAVYGLAGFFLFREFRGVVSGERPAQVAPA
ncbi:MAG: hypothetical protein KC441_10060 [Anaerolineales bacterium]|nr:hypothetical protein [Anaerolineales bacterium]